MGASASVSRISGERQTRERIQAPEKREERRSTNGDASFVAHRCTESSMRAPLFLFLHSTVFSFVFAPGGNGRASTLRLNLDASMSLV